MAHPRSRTFKGFRARLAFNTKRRYDDIRTWFAIDEFDEFTGEPTGWVIKLGARTGEIYRVPKGFNEVRVCMKCSQSKPLNLENYNKTESGWFIKTCRDCQAAGSRMISVVANPPEQTASHAQA